jgi:hypothetical protein
MAQGRSHGVPRQRLQQSMSLILYAKTGGDIPRTKLGRLRLDWRGYYGAFGAITFLQKSGGIDCRNNLA